jgi:hypothetical protein
MTGVLGFLRREDEYDAIVGRAGQYAADWTLANHPALGRKLHALLPARWRMRRSLKLLRELVHATYPPTRCVVRTRRGQASIELRGSLFCDVREPLPSPLCGYYAAAANRILQGSGVHATTVIGACRATGHASCTITAVSDPRARAPAPVASASNP